MKRLGNIPVKAHVLFNFFFVLIIISSFYLLNGFSAGSNYDDTLSVTEFSTAQTPINFLQDSLRDSQDMVIFMIMQKITYDDVLSADKMHLNFDMVDKSNTYSAKVINDMNASSTSEKEKKIIATLSGELSAYLDKQNKVKQLLYNSNDNSEILSANIDMTGDYNRLDIDIGKLRYEEESILQDKVDKQAKAHEAKEDTIRPIQFIIFQVFLIIEVIWINIILRILNKHQNTATPKTP